MATAFYTQTGNGEYRLQFETDNMDHFLLMQATARQCIDGKPQTHADQIRAMSDEELATAIWAAFNDNDYLGKLFCDGKAGCLLECGDFDCDDNKEKDCVLRWLQQPAEVSGDA